MSFQRGNLPNVSVNFNLPKDNDDLVTPQYGPGTASAWPDVKDSDEQDLDQEIFNSMVSHTSFSIDGTGAGGGAGGGMPDTPVKKAVFGTSGAGVGGGPIAMGGARGWMTTLPDRGGKAFGGRNAPRPSLPIRFPELSPDSPDDSPAAGRSKLPTIDSNESPTMHQFWNPGGPDESPSLRPRRKSSETSGLPRRKSAGGDISLNLGVRKQKTADSPKRPPLGGPRRSYGSLGLGRPGGRERDPIPKFPFEEGQENQLGLSTGGAKAAGPLVASTSANSFLAPSTSLGVVPFMRRASSGTFSSDGEASVSGTPTRRGAVGGTRGGLGGPARPVQPVGARLAQAPARPAAPVRSSLPIANWRLVTPSPSLSSLASMGSPLTDSPSAPTRKTARASPILSKGKRTSVPLPAFHPPAVVEPDPTMTLGRLEREYTTVQQIGKGTFGQVLKVEKDGRLFAVKRSKPFEGVRHRRRVLEEVDILQHIATGGGHSNVLRFVDAWEQDGRSLILTEMCELGNLADFLVEWGERFARLDEPRVWKMASDLSHGLAFIHAAGVIHLDLKPANMFVTIEGRIRIGDFGMAARWPRPASDSDGFEREGDRDYMAPEILQGVYVGCNQQAVMSFPPHDIGAQFNFPKEEEKVIAFWREIDAFRTSLTLSEGRPEFSFYDGPPFATGLPHYGHLLAGTVKDIVTRHAHASGFHVERRFGWDTHGLPVEHEIDKKLGITGREDVMAMGIDKYNAECRAIVMRYAGEWRTTVERMGRWIDFDNDYKTLNLEFMESCWWAFSELFKKGMVYRGLRVMPYSTGCTTPLSNFEAGLDYRDVSDPAVTVSFPLVDDPSTSLLAWTTTPWTLPSNLGLCVHPEFTYVKIHDPKHKCNFILHENLLTTLYKDPKKADFKKVGQFKGADMKGWRYTPLFDYFTEQFEDRAFRVLNDTYVTSDSGTGIVHQAPAFGEDDHRIALAHGVIRNDEMPPCPLDDAGRFTKEVSDFEGQYVKTADKEIQKVLKTKGRLIVQSTVIHQYPFCWRSHTPLLYKAIPSWFIRVQPVVDQLVKNNAETR
ncbi:isoleucine--tRNA ligase, partial [Ceratobasidium sp. UAMH 11750]